MTPKSVFSIEIEEEEEESNPFSFMVCIYAVLSTVALLSSLSTSLGIIELSLSLSFSLLQNEQRLRKAVSDVSSEIGKYRKELEAITKIDEVKQAECECCGLVEDCTPDYIVEVKDSYSDKWVCGLCSEAVKERLIHGPRITVEEAVSSHKDFCQKFNNTTRLNPKLSLTCTMRDIVKKKSENRDSKTLVTPKLGRTISCVPRINANTK